MKIFCVQCGKEINEDYELEGEYYCEECYIEAERQQKIDAGIAMKEAIQDQF